MCDSKDYDFFKNLGIYGDSDLFEMDNNLSQSQSLEKVTYPCEQCGGTGKFLKTYGYGYKAQRLPVTCPGCKGRGEFTTPKSVREKNRANKKASKQRRIDADRQEFEASNPGMIDFLKSASTWSGFASSMFQNIMNKGGLTPNQLTACQKMKAKIEQREAVKAATPNPQVDISRIREMFDSASKNLKRPKIRCARLEISKAPDNGRNAGALYVKIDHEYAGKIIGSDFIAVRSAPDSAAQMVQDFAADPKGKLTEHGRVTGSCGCCGRELTDPNSIKAGIGPICAGRFEI